LSTEGPSDLKDAGAVPWMTFNLQNYYQEMSCNTYQILYFLIGDENYFPDVRSSVQLDQLNCILFKDENKKYFFVSLK
jgi:hypothetical protein